ncbi:unnamed protein product [Heligmosomoides polygyrus]|uniref:Endoribonuclease n=1 Tax=Heligmosomoides polygyrus TaxID=6339 RepID=A0A183FKS0_HELPZ|nr:unnamed protein product [Heligmosomoides polygyrus]
MITYNIFPAFNVRNDELLEMSRKLRNADENKALPGQIMLNFQGHTNTRDSSDSASGTLFAKVDQSLLTKPSYSQFLALMNNFNRETGLAEPRVSVDEVRLMKMKITVIFERAKTQDAWHPFARDPTYFRYWIAQLWFIHYSRASGRTDTSGFEHIFIGEEKNDEVSGLHNWLRLYMLERNKSEDFDYKGFVEKRGNVMAAVKFTWKGDLKRLGSILIGTSPEFEMALYTLCFPSRRGRDKCPVKRRFLSCVEIDGCRLSITSYDIVQNNKVFIGSIFPTANADVGVDEPT